MDDALALATLLAEPDALELLAVTTVGRGGETRARVAATLLGLAGRTDVEVCVGEERPLLRGPERFNWFGHEALCVADAPAAPISIEAGAERIVRAAREAPGLSLLAVGPLTNLARALAIEPSLPRLVSRLAIMGGHVREVRIGRHRCEPGIDYNLCSDPEAAVAVLGAGFETLLVTADVTLRSWLPDAEVERLAAGGSVARELARQIAIWKPVQHRIFTELGGDLAPDNAAYLHDPLTVLALLDDPPLRFERLRIVTHLEAGVLRTRELDPERGVGALMQVATDVDPARAARAVAERLLRL